MHKKTIFDLQPNGTKILVRLDLNVPLSGTKPGDDILVSDDTRIRAALPTLRHLLDHGAALILCSHLGRPKSAADIQFKLDPVAGQLSELLGKPVAKVDELVGSAATKAAGKLHPGELLLLENSRFHPGEKKNDPELAAQLGALADHYVNDAFGSAHRAHATTTGAAEAMRNKGGMAVAGMLMEKELNYLGAAISDPPHPYVAIMGGAKISDKILVIDNLLELADKVLIGGGMANTFLRAQGLETGKSLVEEEALPEAERLLAEASDRLILPVDVVVADRFAADAVGEIVAVFDIQPDQMALDIGPQSVALFRQALAGAKLAVWNGPMGVFEFDCFAAGTNQLAALLAEMTESDCRVIIGGGDSAAAVNQAGLAGQMSHVSTGGGASLALLEGKTLPGIAALDDA